MKRIVLLSFFFMSVVLLQAQTFRAERENDIREYSRQMEKLENAYLSHNIRALREGVKQLLQIMQDEMIRSAQDLAAVKQAMDGGRGSGNMKLKLQVKKNRLDIMKYIRNRVISFDISTIYDYSQREVAGFRSGLNHFKVLMEYNLDPTKAITHINLGVKTLSTPQ